jgi:hypothetical protein
MKTRVSRTFSVQFLFCTDILNIRDLLFFKRSGRTLPSVLKSVENNSVTAFGYARNTVDAVLCCVHSIQVAYYVVGDRAQ